MILGVSIGSPEGAELVPMVAAREDAAEGEDDDQEERRAEGEPEGRPRCVHVGRREIRALHSLRLAMILPSVAAGAGVVTVVVAALDDLSLPLSLPSSLMRNGKYGGFCVCVCGVCLGELFCGGVLRDLGRGL